MITAAFASGFFCALPTNLSGFHFRKKGQE
jgi:hypothetical protein